MALIAIDSETQDGLAILLTKSFAFAEPVSWETCMEFLATEREMMCWNADYDCQACLKYLPRQVRDRLAVIGEVRYHGYWIKYVPHKFMRVWRRSLYDYREKWYHLFTVYDLQQFYNCSLDRAAEKLGVTRKVTIPKSWYAHMQDRLKDPRTRERVLHYAMGDARTLQQIIDRTVEAFAVAGLQFERPFSNASFAERYFRKKFRYTRNRQVERFAQRAYHGGRIECLKVGFFKRAYNIDIHSAYPAKIANLIKPDGEWFYERGTKATPITVRSDCEYGFLDCTLTIPQNEPIGPIPFRRLSGNIAYPVGTFRKTITLTEYRYLQRRNFKVYIHCGWFHIWTRGIQPFAEIYEIYRRRKQDPRLDYALKIVMNSTYGKFAQLIETNQLTNIVDSSTRIFDRRIWQKRVQWKSHTSFVYAAEITAYNRIKLLEDIPVQSVISYSTDGVFTTKPVQGLRSGDGLGEWSHAEKVRDLVVVGSGVYAYTDSRNHRVTKFRGFNPQFDLHLLLRRARRRHCIGLRVLRNTSLRLAYLKQSPREMNVLRKVVRLLDVNFDTKRVWSRRWNAGDLLNEQFESKPWIYYGKVKVPLWE